MTIEHDEYLDTLPARSPSPDTPYPFPRRIFGVGMNKTGTSTLSRALYKLGVGPIATQRIVARMGLVNSLLESGEYEPAVRFAGIYRVFEDRPWNMWDMYRRLDARYPDSRFILTRRDPESWWRSVHRWITVTKPHTAERYRLHLKAATTSKRDMMAAYLRFNEEICAYFRGRSDFLIMDVESGDAWTPLCRFLELPVPDARFPHANRQSYDNEDAVRMFSRKVRQTIRPHKEPVDPPLNVDQCIRCGDELHMKKKRKRRNFLVRQGECIKEPYRWLQRTAFNLSEKRDAPDVRFAALRASHPDLSIDDMAVVTCFFNPTGSRRRTENYRTFRRALEACGLPVLTVELAFGNDPFMLDQAAGAVLALRSASCMWQKERLLNIGIREMLNRGYRKIIWLDADVVFEEPERWPWYVAAELSHFPLCQVFRSVQIERAPGRKPVPGISAVRFFREVGAWFDQNPRGPSTRRILGILNGYSGFGWAATAEVLEQAPLYDRAIVGGGDKQIFAASCPRTEGWEDRITRMMTTNFAPCDECGHLNDGARYRADYLAWADHWRNVVQGRMGCANLALRSLYHGNHQNRHYRLRRDILLRHEYDPANDLALDADGCWKWASDKPAMHLQVQGYFFERRDIT